MSPVGRRVAIVVVALFVAAGCAAAGAWQWDRHATRSASNATQEANADAEPVPLELLVDPGRPLDTADTWRPAVVVGRYLPESTVLLRNRPVEGRPAIGVLEVFSILEGSLAGQSLVVHRGWVQPPDDVAEAEPVPVPPGTRVELVVRLRPSEPPTSRRTTPGQVVRIDVEQVVAASGATRSAGGTDGTGTTLEVYGVLLSESGAPVPGMNPVPLPDTGFGPHLSYALQWWFFAIGALVGGVVLVRRDIDEDGGQPRPPRRPRRRSAEEEEEDALVDAAGRSGRTTGLA